MKDKICLVTGANVGIGLETARGLAQQGATVVMTSRNKERGQAAVADVQKTTESDRVHLLMLDLASSTSIRAAVTEFSEKHERLDVLVNNAGLILSERHTTEDGFETTFGVNHLGHFLFTHLLMDRLRAAPAARIVNVASEAHRKSRGLDFDDLMWEKRPYTGFLVYGASKLANILYTQALARRLEGTTITTNSLHPGVVSTGFAADGDVSGPFKHLVNLARPFMLTPEKGARTSLYVATSPDLEGKTGGYYARARPKIPTKHGQDTEAAERLWTESEKLWGL